MQQPSLEQLNDIVEPGQAGWWPPSWLTIAVVAVVLAGVLVLATVLFRRWQKSKVRKAAMKQLLQHKDANTEQITVLLKRAALAYYPRELVATKHSRTWLVFFWRPYQITKGHLLNLCFNKPIKTFTVLKTMISIEDTTNLLTFG